MKSVTQKLFNVPAGRYNLADLAKLLGEEPSVTLGKRLSKVRGKAIGENTMAIRASGRFREFIFEPNVKGHARRGEAEIDQTASSASHVPACYPSSDSFDGVESHLTGGIGVGSGDVSNLNGHLGIVGYDYSPVAEVIRAAKSKGVRLLESDLINDEAKRINQGVVIFRGVVAQLVDAIYDSGISGAAIEEILQTLRGCNLPDEGGNDRGNRRHRNPPEAGDWSDLHAHGCGVSKFSSDNVKVMAHPLAGASVERGVEVEIRWENR